MTQKPKTKKAPAKARRHAAVENVSIFGVTGRLGPLGLILYAEHFLAAARAVKAPDEAPNFPVVRAYLVCHALEVAFKAFLALKGKSLLELSGGAYGHDLNYLIEEAERNDLRALVLLDERQRFQIARASVYYGEKVFEYPAVSFRRLTSAP